jgi:arylsulfatase A-like enzyme
VRRLVLLLLGLLAGCGWGGAATRPGAAPVVVLVTIDTLRADHVGAYGNPWIRTPALDGLAAEGVLFERAYAQANVTLPSHMSLLSSLPLATHGVLSNSTAAVPSIETLPSVFAAAGYAVGVFVSTPHLGPGFVVGKALRGVEHYDAPSRASKVQPAPETMARALAWIATTGDRPVFAWIHLWDPHMPYQPPPPHDAAYYAGPDRAMPGAGDLADADLGWVLHDPAGIRRAMQRHAGVLRVLKRRWGTSSREARRLIEEPTAVRQHGASPGELGAHLALVAPVGATVRKTLPYNQNLAGFLNGVRDPAYPKALYAGEVSFSDTAVGMLRQSLAAWGVERRTVLAVTADHGEGLGEHDVYFDHHGQWEETLHVPLILWAPGRLAAARRTTLSSGLDVAPTLLGAVGVPIPAAMEGRNLAAATVSTGPIVTEHGQGLQIAIHDGRWKLVRTLQPFAYNARVFGQAGEVRLFDLVDDPGERADRAAHAPEVRAALEGPLDAWMDRHGLGRDGRGYAQVGATPAPVSPDRLQQLRALGYAE